MARIIIVSGPPGAGKSTVARGLAESDASALAMHMHTDDMYAYVRKGFIPPWRPESQAQNVVLMKAMAASAAICARGGYAVFVDGIVGPWFLDPWLAAARTHALDLRYIVLRPDEAETVARATARTAPGAMTDAAVVRQMCQAFAAFPPPPGHFIDTTGQTADETVARVAAGLDAGDFRLA
jgi:predicted kinase